MRNEIIRSFLLDSQYYLQWKNGLRVRRLQAADPHNVQCNADMVRFCFEVGFVQARIGVLPLAF